MQSLFAPEENHFLSIDELCRPGIHFFAAREGTQVLGCGALAVKGPYGEIKSMFVDPSARGKGVAAQLMDAIEDKARDLNLDAMMLETGDLLHDAHRLYGRMGFSVRGPFGEYIENTSSIFMEKTLT